MPSSGVDDRRTSRGNAPGVAPFQAKPRQCAMQPRTSVRRPTTSGPPCLRAVEEGVGSPLGLLPGLGGTTRYWEGHLELLTCRARVVRLDLLGFGDSPKPWHDYTVGRHVASLAAATAHLPAMTLVGHSLGAALALMLAARYPTRVTHLVLLGLPYFGNRDQAYRYFHAAPTHAWWATNLTLMALTCLLTRRLLGRLLPYVVTHVPRAVAEDVVQHTWCSSTSSLWNVLYDHDLCEDVAALPDTLPVTCIHGDGDVMAPIAHVHALAAGRSSWHVVTLPEVDHHPWLRRPAVCAMHMLRSVSPDA